MKLLAAAIVATILYVGGRQVATQCDPSTIYNLGFIAGATCGYCGVILGIFSVRENQ